MVFKQTEKAAGDLFRPQILLDARGTARVVIGGVMGTIQTAAGTKLTHMIAPFKNMVRSVYHEQNSIAIQDTK